MDIHITVMAITRHMVTLYSILDNWLDIHITLIAITGWDRLMRDIGQLHPLNWESGATINLSFPLYFRIREKEPEQVNLDKYKNLRKNILIKSTFVYSP